MSVPMTRSILDDLLPAEAAARWKILIDSGGSAEAGLFEEWLKAEPANGAAWAELERAWAQFADADDEIFADLRQQALSARPQAQRRWLALAAACLVAFVAGGTLLMTRGVQSGSAPGSDQLYETGNEVRKVVLADGSLMELAPNTQITVGFAKERRRATLNRGQVMFSVRHDETAPFKLTAGSWSVTDLGTRFTTGLNGSRIEVSLFEGGLRIEDGRHPATVLKPGQEYFASAGQKGYVSTLKEALPPARSDGMVEFDATTLEQAVAEFNDSNSTKLRIVDAKIADLHITGRFRLNDPSHFADAIAQILPIKSVRVGNDRIDLHKR